MRMSSAGERKLVARRKALFRALEEMPGKPVIVEGKRDKESLERCRTNFNGNFRFLPEAKMDVIFPRK